MHDTEIPAIPPWAAMGKAMKTVFLELRDDGATPPVVIMEEDDGIRTAFVANELSPELRLACVASLKRSINPRALVLCADSYHKRLAKGADISSIERGQFDREYLAGDPEVIQSLGVWRLGRSGAINAYYFPYLYSGQGTPLTWLDSQALTFDPTSLADAAGDLPRALHRIAQLPPIEADAPGRLKKLLKTLPKLKKQAFIRDICLRNLSHQGFHSFQIVEMPTAGPADAPRFDIAHRVNV